MAAAWWKGCRARAKHPENDTAVRLNIKHADGSAFDVEGPFTKAEADELTTLALRFATRRSAPQTEPRPEAEGRPDKESKP